MVEKSAQREEEGVSDSTWIQNQTKTSFLLRPTAAARVAMFVSQRLEEKGTTHLQTSRSTVALPQL